MNSGNRSMQLELGFISATACPPAHTRDATPATPLIPTPRPAVLPAGVRWREVSTPLQTIGFILQRSRRRSIGFVITDEGLRITAPHWSTLSQIDKAVYEKSSWIVRTLQERQRRKAQLAMADHCWQVGGQFPYLGKRITLALAPDHRHVFLAGNADAPQDGDTLGLPLPAQPDPSRIRDLVHAWLQQRANHWFGARLTHFLAQHDLPIRRWRLSSAATRWGSCSCDGSIRLNWRLIHFSPSIIDYVIAHELAHLRQMNHSAHFWAEVGQILPGFEPARDLLRQHDPAGLPPL